MRYQISDRGHVADIYAPCAARAAYAYVHGQPAADVPSKTRLLVTAESLWNKDEPATWLLLVVRNRTKGGAAYVQFRDLGAEKRAREFRAWWRERYKPLGMTEAMPDARTSAPAPGPYA